METLNKISFSVTKGEIISILGPSGCGKSTLLSIVGGLTTPNTGMIRWDGISLTSVPPHLRNFGLMFQDNALFPHRNVYDNKYKKHMIFQCTFKTSHFFLAKK